MVVFSEGGVCGGKIHDVKIKAKHFYAMLRNKKCQTESRGQKFDGKRFVVQTFEL